MTPARARLAGVDVSHWQGAVDWNLAKTAGVGFAYLKATDGPIAIDSRFHSNWVGAKLAGIPRGAYHFFRANEEIEPQISSFIAAVGEDAGELPPALDLEVGPMDRVEFEHALLWLESVEAHYGRSPALYADLSVIRQLAAAGRPGSSDAAWPYQFVRFPLWVADYGGGAPPAGVLAPWGAFTFWQHTPQGTMPGINAAVDLDYFNGSALELAALKTARVGDATT